MFFAKQNKAPVQTLSLSLSNHSSTAFGPGSVINGSLVLELGKPTLANNIKVVFECSEKDKQNSYHNVFTVESIVWPSSKEKIKTENEIEAGRHMFLFAIKFPAVNYPPSLSDSNLGHSITYTLQGIFTTVNYPQVTSNTLPITYYPLINSRELTYQNPNDDLVSQTCVFEPPNSTACIRLKAELSKPAYCPGDTIVVRTTINNPTDLKITHVQVSLIATTKLYQGTLTHLDSQHSETPINSSSNQNCKYQTQTLNSENFYVTIPKKSLDVHNIFRVKIPPDCSPSTGPYVSRLVDISHNILVKIPLPGVQQGTRPANKWSISGLLSPASSTKVNDYSPPRSVHPKGLEVTLPVAIATVPQQHSLPPQLKISLPSFNEQPELPVFISENESISDASPVSPYANDDNWSVSVPGSPLSTSADGLDIENSIDATANAMYQDQSGHLMVPLTGDGQRKSISSSSTSSASDNDNHENEPPKQVIVN
ncbi:hypothetical protein NQZ79_g113 [Umbelopsis isabellina]|nr:hypothetical protein NQZ79_g113 [Umbelopsis isabellina]